MSQTTKYYTGLVTSEYAASPKMLAWLAASIQPFQDLQVCLNSFVEAFNLDSAVGAQLDIIGEIVGQTRTVAFQPSGVVSPILDDDTYRLLLKSCIAQNHWDGTIDGLIDIWKALFPGGIIIVNDHQNMTVDIYVAGSFTSILTDLILNGYMLPRPQGVLFTYAMAVLPMFGFDRDDYYVAGFDLGHMV
jgi:predicted methyltransferase